MQHKSKLLFFVVGLGLLVTLVLSACGPQPQGNGSNTPKHGGTLTDALFEEPDSLLSNGTNETFAVLVDATIWAPLVFGDPEGNLHPGILKEIPSVANGDISADGLHYTLKLRSGLMWSDGQPLTAEDVVFTLNLWDTPAYGAKTDTVGLPFIDWSTLKATDATTVTFSMKKVFVPLFDVQLEDQALAPMPKHIFETMDPGAILKSQESFAPTVSSGPFKLQSRTKGDHIDVVRNPNYYQAAQGLPYLDAIHFKIISDTSTILTALQSHSVDASWFLDITKEDSYKAIQGYTVVHSQAPANTEYVTFNLHDPILSDLQVRRAISMAIDYDTIISQILKGTGQRTCDEDSGSPAHESNLTCQKFDPAGAKALLDADGWTMGSDGYRHKNGKILELKWSTTANNARRQQGQEIGQQNLKDIGIKIDIQNYPADALFGTILPSGQYEIGEFASSVGYDADNAATWACNQTAAQGGANWTLYCNPAVDADWLKEETNPDPSVRLAAFKDIHQHLLQDVPTLFLYSYGQQGIASNSVHNYSISDNGPSETWNVWNWWKS